MIGNSRWLPYTRIQNSIWCYVDNFQLLFQWENDACLTLGNLTEMEYKSSQPITTTVLYLICRPKKTHRRYFNKHRIRNNVRPTKTIVYLLLISEFNSIEKIYICWYRKRSMCLCQLSTLFYLPYNR